MLFSDVPNAPRLQKVTCNKRDASIQWNPMGDNRAPILRYTIQYNTSFTPDTWESAFDAVPATDMTYTVSTYARNPIGDNRAHILRLTLILLLILCCVMKKKYNNLHISSLIP